MAYLQTSTMITTTDSGKNLATAVFSAMTTMGWELYDDISTWRKVYRSAGEDNNGLPMYILLDGYYSNAYWGYMYYAAFGYWNTSTHTGLIPAQYLITANYIDVVTNWGEWIISGNKDLVYIAKKNTGGDGTLVIYGTVPNLYYNPYAILSSGVSAGNNKTFSVDNTDNFFIGKKYAIVDGSNGTIEYVTITNKTINSLTVTTLTNAYTTNSVVAISPYKFGFTRRYNSVFFDVIASTTYDSDNCFSFYPEAVLSTVNTTPYQSYVFSNACPNLKTDATIYGTDSIIVGTMQNATDVYPPIIYTSLQNQGYIYSLSLNNPETGIPTEASTTYLKDTTKTWTTNQWTGKTVVITAGNGEGQIREIASNTSDTLTLLSNFTTMISTSSVYEIVNAIYYPVHYGLTKTAIKIQSLNTI